MGTRPQSGHDAPVGKIDATRIFLIALDAVCFASPARRIESPEYPAAGILLSLACYWHAKESIPKILVLLSRKHPRAAVQHGRPLWVLG